MLRQVILLLLFCGIGAGASAQSVATHLFVAGASLDVVSTVIGNQMGYGEANPLGSRLAKDYPKTFQVTTVVLLASEGYLWHRLYQKHKALGLVGFLAGGVIHGYFGIRNIQLQTTYGDLRR